MHACTIVAKNYLAQARVLANSFARFCPRSSFTILLIDELSGRGEKEDSLEFLSLSDIGLEEADLQRMLVIYDVTELSTAVKPWLLRTLLVRNNEPTIYFDPDIEIFAPLEHLATLAREHSIVLTPHVTEPMPRDNLKPRESDILETGIYNLGFIAVAPGCEAFLDFWSARLRRECIIDPTQMRFVDQRWVDFVPGFYRHYILRDDTTNVAYWNLDRRDLRWTHDRYEINGRPLTFFHFSGYDPDSPDVLSKHQGLEPRIRISDNSALARLCQQYAEKLEREGFSKSKWVAYCFHSLANGIVLTKAVRQLYRNALAAFEAGQGEEPPLVFVPGGEEALLKWLNEAANPRVPSITRYMLATHGSREDLRRNFPRPLAEDAESLRRWFVENGARDTKLPRAVIANLQSSSAACNRRRRMAHLDQLENALTKLKQRLASKETGESSNSTTTALQTAMEDVESIRSLQRYLESTAAGLRTQMRHLETDVWTLKVKRADAAARVQNLERQLREIQESTLWRLVSPFSKLLRHKRAHSGNVAKDLLFAIEAPTEWKTAETKIVIAGWCFSRIGRAVAGIRTRVGRKGHLATYGIERLDVARTHEQFPAAAHSGFRIELDLPSGTNLISLDAITQGEQWEQFFTHQLIVSDQKCTALESNQQPSD